MRVPMTDPVSIIERGMRLYAAGDLVALRALVHPEAEIQMALLHNELAHGPEGLEEALRAATFIHAPRMDRIEPVDEHAAIMVGRVRYALEGGGFGDRAAAWLSVLRDGLIWRVRLYPDVSAARRAYRQRYRVALHAGAADEPGAD
jgi:hypothetical protein